MGRTHSEQQLAAEDGGKLEGKQRGTAWRATDAYRLTRVWNRRYGAGNRPVR
jgi:hypothetical protein